MAISGFIHQDSWIGSLVRGRSTQGVKLLGLEDQDKVLPPPSSPEETKTQLEEW